MLAAARVLILRPTEEVGDDLVVMISYGRSLRLYL